MKDLVWDVSVKSLQNIKRFITPDRGDYNEVIEYLIDNDFYNAPCSSNYHLCFKSGLILHSTNVLNEAVVNYYKYPFYKDNLNIQSIFISSFFHDLCKINLYKMKLGRKRLDNGQWVDDLKFEIDETEYPPLGHGEKSLYLINKLIKILPEEAIAIRWHMGKFDASSTGYIGEKVFGRAFNSDLLKIVLISDYSISTFTEKNFGIYMNGGWHYINEEDKFKSLIDLNELKDYYVKNIK